VIPDHTQPDNVTFEDYNAHQETLKRNDQHTTSQVFDPTFAQETQHPRPEAPNLVAARMGKVNEITPLKVNANGSRTSVM
jgi:hypothetical protein